MFKTYISFFLLIFSLSFFSCKTSAPPDAAVSVEEEGKGEAERLPEPEPPPAGDTLPVSAFREIWTYVAAGREAALTPGLPLTDIGYFAADINSYGELIEVPDRRKLPPFSGRVHLVVKCDGRALSYFTLRYGSPERKALTAGLISAVKDYDGLHINLENVPPRSANDFFTFLQDLKAGLPDGKMFSMAVAARTRKIADDVYDYGRISPLMDRILVMAYDEHWSGSSPGPVASLRWCENVAAYSLKAIGSEKLVMGIPFYGRAWGDITTSQAYIYPTIERIIRENNIADIKYENGIPAFEYKVPVSVKVYFENEYSISARMEMYRSMGVTAVGFWRLGQENQAIWGLLRHGE